jgi:hypothetical protein
LLGNRFIAWSQEKANLLSTQLNKISETYDSWREAQRGWIYLDNIFNSPEIRADCPVPNAIFTKMSKNLAKHLKKVKVKPQVLFVVGI